MEHEELQKVWNEFIRNRELVTDGKLAKIQKSRKANVFSETHLHIYIKEELIKQFMEGYTTDKEFSKVLEHTRWGNFDKQKY